MRELWLLGLLALLLIVQVTSLDFIKVAGVKPDLILVLVVFNSFLQGQREGAFWGFVAGLLEDMVTGSYFGLNALDKMATGYLVGWGEARLYKESTFVAVIITCLASLFSGLVHYLLLAYLGLCVMIDVALFQIILPSAIYNVFFAALFYKRFYRSNIRGLFSLRRLPR